MRAERVGPVVALVALPVLSAAVGISHLRQISSAGSRGGQLVLLTLATLEAALTVLAAVVVGFAIGLRSL